VVGVNGHLKASEKAPDVLVGRVVIEDLIEEPFEPAVIDNGQHTEGPVVEFVGGDIAREVIERPSEVIPRYSRCRFFSPLASIQF
jgi:hypothetical protein